MLIIGIDPGINGAICLFKDGKIVSMETGATPLSDDYKLVGSE